MLTDIFANRYANVPLWDEFDERSRRLLTQAFGIVSEQVFPYYVHGNVANGAESRWDDLNKKLATELGLKDLSEPTYTYPYKWQGETRYQTGMNSKLTICDKFVCADYDGSVPPDRFIKDRLSFIEIAFREKDEVVAKANADLANNIARARLGIKRRGVLTPYKKLDPEKLTSELAEAEASEREKNEKLNDDFQAVCNELNTRLRQAGTNLQYHNGFIQMSSDELTADEIEQPFWALVSDPKWNSVDHDMKEAIDLRDSGGRDPAWHAAKALESTVKIISGEKGWTHGTEKGAVNYLDNLRASKNGAFVNGWEHETLARFFSEVRNPFGHGAGSADVPELSPAQTVWAIEFCMSWIKNLIRRM